MVGFILPSEKQVNKFTVFLVIDTAVPPHLWLGRSKVVPNHPGKIILESLSGVNNNIHDALN